MWQQSIIESNCGFLNPSQHEDIPIKSVQSREMLARLEPLTMYCGRPQRRAVTKADTISRPCCDQSEGRRMDKISRNPERQWREQLEKELASGEKASEDLMKLPDFKVHGVVGESPQPYNQDA